MACQHIISWVCPTKTMEIHVDHTSFLTVYSECVCVCGVMCVCVCVCDVCMCSVRMSCSVHVCGVCMRLPQSQ